MKVEKADRYALSMHGKSRQTLLEFACIWAKPLGYVDFDGSLAEQTADYAVYKKEFKTYNRRLKKYSSHGGARVSTQSLYRFYRFCVEIKDYIEDFLDIGWELCPECGRPHKVPEFPATDIICDCGHMLKKACDIRNTDLWETATAPAWEL